MRHPISRMANAPKFHWKLKTIALDKGIKNQISLARRSGVDKNVINDLWNGKQRSVSAKTIGRLCVALGCRPNDILAFSQ